MKPRYVDSLTVVYEDTDSVLYRIKTDDLWFVYQYEKLPSSTGPVWIPEESQSLWPDK